MNLWRLNDFSERLLLCQTPVCSKKLFSKKWLSLDKYMFPLEYENCRTIRSYEWFSHPLHYWTTMPWLNSIRSFSNTAATRIVLIMTRIVHMKWLTRSTRGNYHSRNLPSIKMLAEIRAFLAVDIASSRRTCHGITNINLSTSSTCWQCWLTCCDIRLGKK